MSAAPTAIFFLILYSSNTRVLSPPAFPQLSEVSPSVQSSPSNYCTSHLLESPLPPSVPAIYDPYAPVLSVPSQLNKDISSRPAPACCKIQAHAPADRSLSHSSILSNKPVCPCRQFQIRNFTGSLPGPVTVFLWIAHIFSPLSAKRFFWQRNFFTIIKTQFMTFQFLFLNMRRFLWTNYLLSSAWLFGTYFYIMFSHN